MIDTNLNIIWQDDYLLVVNKQPYVSVGMSESDKDITLVEIVNRELGIPLDRAGIIHRLDKNTSGVILIAKNQEILDQMQAQFKARTVKKKYICLTHGVFEEKAGEINAPIDRNEINREKFTISAEGRDARTMFEVNQTLSLSMESISTIVGSMTKKEQQFYSKEATHYSLLTVSPYTGRTHQIRVHMKYIHHPLVSDAVYTGKKLYRLDHRWCDRQFLHAFSIEFTHPVTQEHLLFTAPLADDLQRALSFLS